MDFKEELGTLKSQLVFDQKVDVPDDTANVVIAGLGGSGIAGRIFQELYSSKPVMIADDYTAPSFVSKSTLFIAISYSGNTEETLSSTADAKARGAHIVTISAGGKLYGQGDQNIRIPRRDLQPRSVTGYMIMPLLRGFGIVSEEEADGSYKLLDALDNDNIECLVHAKAIMEGSCIPAIFGSHPYKGVAYRWKTQFNENAKVLAYSNSFPELNHNDTMALAQTYLKDRFYFMVFGSESERIKKRIEVTQEITASQFNIIEPKGRTYIERMFYLLHYGDYVSYHLAVLRGADPADISLIERLKAELG